MPQEPACPAFTWDIDGGTIMLLRLHRSQTQHRTFTNTTYANIML